ncbi:arylamine N-acetyltransferase [Pseudomonas sp. NFXW11]|uniref:arylamine N-acetyltransferase family protein n=1 Tax=Pseudomonas sp. NFXW11 TaxID=2819531 RepID=UPI003CE8064B
MSAEHSTERQAPPLEGTLPWLAGYLERLENPGACKLDLATLARLHEAHITHIPFDMADGFLGQDVPFTLEHVVQKIVYERRGGGCTQMNGIFAEVLHSLGFSVQRTLAKTFQHGVCRELSTHMVLLVKVEGKRWLCDVGFGLRGPIRPLSLEQCDEQVPQVQGCHRYRVKRLINREWLVEYLRGECWQGLLVVRDADYSYEEFRVTHFYNTHAPTSLFAQHLICARPHLEGGDLLQNGTLVCVRGKRRSSYTASHLDELIDLLQAHFNIVLCAQHFQHLPPGIIKDDIR